MRRPAGAEVFGLYVHVPFCASRCVYCDFHSQADAAPPWSAFFAGLAGELSARAAAFSAWRWTSLYFGGGTPSLAPVEQLAELITTARRTLGDVAELEITLEANPQDVDAARAAAWRRAGINRLSLGWQTSADRFLRLLGRRHDAAEARAAVQDARAAGFTDLSLDLIFALPGQTLTDLDADLDAALACAPEHVSLYALTYHPGTPLDLARARGEVTPADEELEVAMMERIGARLGDAGLAQYEVSNFARAGRRSRHNSLYWTGAPYLGLGPSAHSFWRDGWRAGRRWETRRDLDGYLRHFGAGAAPGAPAPGDAGCSWVESLAPRQLMQERLLCALRTCDGIDLDEPALEPFTAELGAPVSIALERGWATMRAGRLVPTATGLRFADALAALFF